MPVVPKYKAKSLLVARAHTDFIKMDENDQVDFFKKSIIDLLD
jgi:hypothetical protein